MSEPLQVLPGAVVAGLDVGAGDTAEPAWVRVLAVLVDRLERHGYVGGGFRKAVLARERAYPTGLPTPVPCALPHTDAEHVRRAGLAVATLARPVQFAQMGTPGASVAARWVVMMCLTSAATQLDALQALVLGMRDGSAVEQLLTIEDDSVLAAAVGSWLAQQPSAGAASG